MQRDPANAEALSRVRDRRLRELIGHAWQHSAHYRRAMEAAGVAPEKISTADDLAAMPLLQKQMLRASLRDVVDRRTDLTACVNERTNGTTGEPLVIPSTQEERSFKHGLWFAAYMKCGLRPWHREAKFVIPPGPSGIQWAFQRFGIFRRNYLSVAVPTEKKIAWLREQKPDALFSWGVVLNEISMELERTGESLHVPLIFSSSDTVFQDLVAPRISGKLIDIYGAMESGPLARPCPLGHGYHVDTRWNIVEILDAENRPAASGRIIVTALWRRTTPLIRYELGDLGSWATGPCACGNPMPLLSSLNGRSPDLLELAGGGRLSSGAVTAQFRAVPGIRQFQLVQSAPAEVLVHIIPTPQFPKNAVEQIRWTIEREFAGKLRVQIHIATSIYRPAAEKVCSLITMDRLEKMKARGIDIAPFLEH